VRSSFGQSARAGYGYGYGHGQGNSRYGRWAREGLYGYAAGAYGSSTSGYGYASDGDSYSSTGCSYVYGYSGGAYRRVRVCSDN
jgi:hypothetical protein